MVRSMFVDLWDGGRKAARARSEEGRRGGVSLTSRAGGRESCTYRKKRAEWVGLGGMKPSLSNVRGKRRTRRSARRESNG